MGELPSGSVTFVFTDVEGSTRLLHELGAERYGELLSEHRRAIREAFGRHEGHEIDTQGDAFFYAFSSAADALAAADEAQRHLARGRMRVRVGLHSGNPLLTPDGYVGLDVHRAARIAAAGHGGQVLVSGPTRDLLFERGGLPGGSELIDLGEHRLKDLTQRERIFQLGTATFPPLTSLNQSNLPVAATSLVGRERELADLVALLRDGARAVTVIGPGGTGKTRLALQAAAELVEEFPGGVFWVPLGGLTDPELVIPTIGNALDAQGGDLAEHIGKKKLLLLLDNFEQLLEAAPAVAALLTGAPGLKVLVTSRSPLHIAAEREYPLDPLSDDDAVEFFAARAAAAGRVLQPDDTIREICRRLDRLPLALELAAARLKVLDAPSLLHRLDRALPLLTSGARDAPQRQRTLRAAIEWSDDLLRPAGRSLLARLGVFAGSFSLDAAEAVASADLDVLAELVDASLLKSSGDGRFLLLETIREYAVERLEDTGEAAARRDSHAIYFLTLAERSEFELAKADQARWMALLVADENNLREAMARSAANADTQLVLRFVSALWLFWYRRGGSEPERWYRLALSMPGDVAPGLRARALYGAAQIPMMRADWQPTRDLLEESRSLAEATADTLTLMRALSDLGTTYHYMGDLEASRRCFDEGLAIARSIGDRGRAAMLVGNAGEAAAEEGDVERAEPLLTEALAEYRAMNDSLGVAGTLDSLGKLAVQRGEIDRAAAYFSEGLSVARPLGALTVLAIFLAEAGRIAVARGQLPAAARMFGATDGLIQRLDVSLYELPDYAASVESARTGLSEDAFGTAHAAGATLELDDALSEAAALLSRVGS